MPKGLTTLFTLQGLLSPRHSLMRAEVAAVTKATSTLTTNTGHLPCMTSPMNLEMGLQLKGSSCSFIGPLHGLDFLMSIKLYCSAKALPTMTTSTHLLSCLVSPMNVKLQYVEETLSHLSHFVTLVGLPDFVDFLMHKEIGSLREELPTSMNFSKYPHTLYFKECSPRPTHTHKYTHTHNVFGKNPVVASLRNRSQ